MAPRRQTGRTGARLSILLVDDDRLVRETTGWMLEDAGHRVMAAADGIAALASLDEHGPVDLLITDIAMPLMGGLALAEAVGRRWPQTAVLLISARPQPAGTRPFVPKPFGRDILLAAVRRTVGLEGGRAPL